MQLGVVNEEISYEIKIVVKMSEGSETVTAWGCDLSYDYVKINGEYRS